MKVQINLNELYPHYTVKKPVKGWPEPVIYVDKATFERWRKISEDYGIIQEELQALYVSAGGEKC